MGFLLSKFWSSDPPEYDLVDSATGLTPRQKQMVRSTWDAVKLDVKANGVELFLILFDEHPDYQKLFRPFADVPRQELPKNRRLLAHATSVMYAITSVVDNLDDPACLVELLVKTGSSHIPRNLKRNHFEDLAVALMKLLEKKYGSRMNDSVKEAWLKTLNVVNGIIIEELEKGSKSDETEKLSSI